MMLAKPVVILCGGRGLRLDSYTQKCVTPVAGRPFLHWKLDQLVANGATEFWLLVAHKWEDVSRACGRKWQGVPIHYIRDQGQGVAQARRHATSSVPFIHWLTYGDSLLDVPIKHGLFPYHYTNDAYPEDAGMRYCWGLTDRGLPRYTRERAWQINTPQDLEEVDAYLRRHGLAR